MLVEEMVKHPHMLSFALIGPEGKVLAFGKRGSESTENSAVLAGLPESIKDKVANNQPLEVFLGNELILGQPFEPFRGFGRMGRGMPPWAFPLSPGHHSRVPGAGHMRGRRFWGDQEKRPEKIYALVRISTQDFLDARRKAVQEALILAALIFLAAGAASWGLWAVARRRSQEMDRLRREVAQAEHLASLGRLAGSVAHEVRNPLSALRGLVQLLAKGHNSETREAKYAEAAVEEVDRLERVVSGLLDYTRPREPRRFPLDLGESLQSVMQLMSDDPRAQGVETAVDVSPGLPQVSADPDQIRQVLLNLVVNALEAMNGRGRLSLSARPLQDRVEVVVEDNGPGLPSGDPEQIFDPFFSTRDRGTGLGLAIARRIIRAHGGQLSAGPSAQGGARFSFTLPLEGDAK
ncbi:MAG: ATP-binding protein, partial [Desulfarculaceae bacterium]|jgi:two-component system sensor histidine kinase HydH